MISLLKQHHPKLCGSLNDKQNNSLTNSINTNMVQCSRNSTPRRSGLASSNDQTPRVSRSTSTPNSKLRSKQPKVEQAKKKQSSFRKAAQRQTSLTLAQQSSLSSDKDSEDLFEKEDVDWNELLRNLQEEYTKFVL